jgi:hypothetical protein
MGLFNKRRDSAILDHELGELRARRAPGPGSPSMT